MAAVKLTKNELKRQKDSLKRFERYLPTLQLKKQQLQMVIRQVEARERERSEARAGVFAEIESWISVFGEQSDGASPTEPTTAGGGESPSAQPEEAESRKAGPNRRVTVEDLVRVREVVVSQGNIAGIDIPVFDDISFEFVGYDLFAMPLWIDAGVDRFRELIRLDAEIAVLRKQRDLLAEELRITTQRVNLFEKVKIPETRENIRQIRIYLGDQQTAEVVRGKIAKNNITRGAGE